MFPDKHGNPAPLLSSSPRPFEVNPSMKPTRNLKRREARNPHRSPRRWPQHPPTSNRSRNPEQTFVPGSKIACAQFSRRRRFYTFQDRPCTLGLVTSVLHCSYKNPWSPACASLACSSVPSSRNSLGSKSSSFSSSTWTQPSLIGHLASLTIKLHCRHIASEHTVKGCKSGASGHASKIGLLYGHRTPAREQSHVGR